MGRLRRSVVVPIAIALLLFAVDAFSKGPSELALMFRELRTALFEITGRLDRIESAVKVGGPARNSTNLEKGQQAYWRGRTAEGQNDCASALPELTKAIELD